MTMQIKDNSSCNISLKQIEILQSIANEKNLQELSKKYPDLLVFPQSLGYFKDDIEKAKIFSLRENKIHTNNIVGFLGVQDESKENMVNLQICSRFDTHEKQYFLQYMLMKVFCPTILDFPTPSENENISNFFLALLFPYYLQKALKQGIFKQYQKREYNDSNVKGTININRHLKKNVPFVGNVAYSCREFSFDNPITQLIRHTLDYLANKKYLFDKSALFNENKRCIEFSTPTFHRQDKHKIIEKNKNKLNHPFFTEYEPLRKICLHILKNEGVSLSPKNENEKVYGVLFDASWLWEEYLNTILSKQGFMHPKNKKKENSIYLFEKNKNPRYPDFYKGEEYVLDAKYKKMNKKSDDNMRGDLHQIITYIHILKSKIGAFIYPNNEITKNETKILGVLNGYAGEVQKIGFAIPKDCDLYANFVNKIQDNEKMLHFGQKT